MKNILKSICLTLTAAYGLMGCTGNFEEYNTDPYGKYTDDPASALAAMIPSLMYIQQNDSQMIDQMVGTLGGYFTLSNRWGGQNFDTFNASDAWNLVPYETIFEDIYPNLFVVEETTKKSGHFYALGRMVRAAAMMRVVDMYGPIPYSKIAKGEFYVSYDKVEDIYKDMIADFEDAATLLSAFVQNYPGMKPMEGFDLIYNGDYAKWARLANSFALRAAVRSNDREAAEAACSHPAGLIESNDQNATMDPDVQGNPYQLAAASWGDLRVNASIVDYMNGYNDPRRTAYFQYSGFEKNKFIGMRSGTANFEKSEVSNYSQPAVTSQSRLPVFLAAETNFLRAEMALKGWNAGGTAQSFYENGVRLSMQQYGVNSSDIDEYLANEELTPADHSDPRGAKFAYDRKTDVKIKWNDGDGEEKNLERIITQKWIANFPMGLEAWADFRRTGYPELAPAIDNLSGGVITDNFRGLRRLRYPFTEKNLNKPNYQAGVALLGGKDDESVDLFWAKKN